MKTTEISQLEKDEIGQKLDSHYTLPDLIEFAKLKQPALFSRFINNYNNLLQKMDNESFELVLFGIIATPQQQLKDWLISEIVAAGFYPGLLLSAESE